MTREEAIEILNASDYFWIRPNKNETEALNMAIEALQADAVEVVRCKDCVYWKYRANYNGDEWGACLFIEELEDAEHWTEDTGFCSYGERSEE